MWQQICTVADLLKKWGETTRPLWPFPRKATGSRNNRGDYTHTQLSLQGIIGSPRGMSSKAS